ncbi:selection and upkeep of intraepithelial T-cells protein 10-like isoform X1 [Peromyscus leucopus]|uniref:selection and upkeep of intraepithelial T-cells protein 10-like isoform X1 n=1 Tax=Peromyscus leucopus TaxID=10041 RepID=UPI001884CF56|nr:selection and upkeep of intraepithelial T-cells protein 10-like isoform X1 [Peromyscus leucopus]
MVLFLRTWKKQGHADIFALIKSHLGVMEPAASCLAGFFMAFLLLQITVLTEAMSLDIQINIQVPDAEGILVECTSGRLIPPVEMTWRDSKGNIIPHSSKLDSQDGLLYLKSSILLKNRTHGPVTCSIYNVTTNQEKKRSIVLPDVLFKPEYMSLMSNRPSCPVIYLIIILVLYCLRGILVFYLKWKTCEFMRGSNKTRLCYELMWECLPLFLCIGFLPLYLNFRSRASILDNAYPLYSNWLWDVCIILVVMMLFFTGLILLLLVTLNIAKEQKAQCQPLEDEILPLYQLSQEYIEQRSPSPFLRDCREEMVQLQGSIVEEIFHQPQGSCGEEIFNPLQPLKLDCSLNWGT